MLNEASDIVDVVRVLMNNNASLVTDEGMEFAAEQAMAELGFAYPVTDAVKVMWVGKRALRHTCYILLIAAAQKFKYKQVNLQQRFDHYKILVDTMDKEYEKALSSDLSVFLNVEAYKMFGSTVSAGFVYDKIGNDLTYEQLSRFLNV